MTAARFELPRPMRARPLTVAEYAALGETEFGYTELLEGRPFPFELDLDTLI